MFPPDRPDLIGAAAMERPRAHQTQSFWVPPPGRKSLPLMTRSDLEASSTAARSPVSSLSCR
ncbi:hypothetical protein RA210_U40136 [Rubrivivax sp. A210]|nr:hypothetical protein RA210_U40136 [Rubrivivax sp. A210]